MAEPPTRRQLIAQAKAGDRLALERLLVMHAQSLCGYIARKRPAAQQDPIDPEDILQQTFVHAFCDIHQFHGKSEPEFEAWLRAIADHRWHDAFRSMNRAKRGGRYRRAVPLQDSTNSIIGLVELLSADGRSPSGYMQRDEAVMAVQSAIRILPDDYRQAIELRFIEGKSLEEVATIMNRSSRSVQGLLDRAKKRMRLALERLAI